MCSHVPPCPAVDRLDREAARVIASHPEQGWSLLCNGLVLFEDTGALLPDRSVIAPHRGGAQRQPGNTTTAKACYADAATAPTDPAQTSTPPSATAACDTPAPVVNAPEPAPSDRLRIAEASPRRKPSPRPRKPSAKENQPGDDEIAQAQHASEQHVPSLVIPHCLAPECGEWPCRHYLEAMRVLRDAGLLPHVA